MKKIWNYLKLHIREDYNPVHYTTVFILLTIAITFNYILDFEDSYLDYLVGWKKVGAFFLMYAGLYYTAVISYSRSYNKSIFNHKNFWLSSITGLFVLSLDNSSPVLNEVMTDVPHQIYIWSFKVLNNLQSFISVLLPLVIFYYSFEKANKDAYGLSNFRFDARPYVKLIAIMIPIIVIASFHYTFLKQYPMYKVTEAHTYLRIPEWLTVITYEVAYALDFITVEFLFRGFFVLGMVAFLGRGSVLTMAVIYCSLHFGKPMGEAISSVFGGYILGVVALETRSIWGGIMVHIAIAWMMELVAWIQKMPF